MILTVCLAVLGMLGVKAQQSIIALHHEGNVTIFAGAKTQEAMDASVKGDTLYLSEGTFAGFNVTHGIVVLGSGEKTVVSGNITITGNDEKKDLGGYVFSGMHLLHDFVVNDTVIGLRVSQCNMNNFTVLNGDGKCVDNGEIIMSYVRNALSLSGSREWTPVRGLAIINSKIGVVWWGGATRGAVSFNHCNVRGQGDVDSNWNWGAAGSTNNVYVNCIVGTARYSSYYNSLYYETFPNLTVAVEKCYQQKWEWDDNLNYPFPDDSLRTAGYLDNDGTVVGITGGDIPYTLELATPHVAEHKVEVDNVNRKMTVTLKMAHDANKKEEE